MLIDHAIYTHYIRAATAICFLFTCCSVVIAHLLFSWHCSPTGQLALKKKKKKVELKLFTVGIEQTWSFGKANKDTICSL